MTDMLRARLQTTLGSAYTIERELGGGGMSRVFVAEDTALARPVVVKVLSPELSAGVNLDRFRREIRVAARLQHPHIVPVLQTGEADGLPYFTMPFVKGESLRVRLQQRDALPLSEVLSILSDVAKALEYAHAQGVVHRDIKPDNVLLAGNAAVVTDFGIAKALSASKTLATGTTLTEVGTSLGTPAYMAPEQAAADPSTDHRADIYAFGILAYELLAGHPPFAGRTPQQLLTAQLAERPVPIASMRPDVPPALADLVMRCLEKNADDRPQSAAALVRTLETVTTSGSAQPAPALLLGGRAAFRNALLVWAAAFLIVVLAARITTNEIGLPDWVFPAAIVAMLLGLPAILITGYVQRTVHRSLARTPALTPGGTPAAASTLATLALKASPHVSWRRTAMGGGTALAVLVLLIVGYMTAWAFGIGPPGSLLGAGKIHARDRLIVTDFRGTGSDSTVAGPASEAVRTDLSESPIITLLSPAEVGSALRLMRRSPTTRIDLPLAQELAAREGAKAVVDGTITPVGGGFLLTLRLVSVSGSELASFHDAANGPTELLPTLDRLARRLRTKIGESLKSVHADPPLQQVTTSSLDALRAFDEGVRRGNLEGDADGAIAAAREAVALDTSFAMAYRMLGIFLSNIEAPQPSVDSALSAAYRHRDRLTERERHLAEAAYFGEHDREKAGAAYGALLALNPQDASALDNVGNIDLTRRQYATADTLFSRALRIDRGAISFGNVIEAELDEGETAAVRRDVSLFRERFPDGGFGPYNEANLDYFENNPAAVGSVASRELANPQPGRRWNGEHLEAFDDVFRGQLAAAARATAEARRIKETSGLHTSPLGDSVMAATFDITLRGQAAHGVARLDSVLRRIPLRSLPPYERPYFDVADAYALGARPDRAKAVLAEYTAEVKDTFMLRDDEPQMHTALGEIALAEHRPTDALREFARGDTAADGYPVACPVCFLLNAGRAYDEAGNRDSAIAVFERYEAVPGRYPEHGPDPDVLYRPLVYKRLGELYETEGDAAHAIANYRQFIALWKDADPDLQAVVADARRRLAKLSAEVTRSVPVRR
jgi:eukaryotic-like serine/threonine-protein kinase